MKDATDATITFIEGEPPRLNIIWARHLLPLVEHPENWAVVRVTEKPNYAHILGTRLRNRTLKPPPGRWEFRATTLDGHGYLYARYLGPDA